MRGFFGVAVYHAKHEDNIGTLWRSAKTYDASLLATVGRRYEPQASDTCKAPLSVPLYHYPDLDDLIEHLPQGCPLVGVELDARAVPLPQFRHPLRALYLLGAEDHGLPPAVLERCHHVVQVPTPQAWSLNVAVAGSLVMADRYAKTGRAA
ncbi:tRNA G18 (ribose-2'-O)-methylase SpoU [Saccharothrix coeruleofusca]|uniref:RNA methyltransferase n=1 Tax=Saccharothrix coeruleofusca TaxID=33919 RepID=UPI001AE29695|nr:RNA methyltransferase [Saccharothrix coeruleofusca]MBP2341048.1 tRNA G18 (ribose-2'-O)-methylase SpoU [Saccharothrix coeruleofusca]